MYNLTARIQLVDNLSAPLRNTSRMMDAARGSANSLASQLGIMAGAAGVVATAFSSVDKAMDFEAQMSKVGAIADATGQDLERLKETAVQLGAETSKSASEIGVSMQELASKGFDTNKIIGAMPGIIKAAEASGEDLALTSDVITSALNAFNLEAGQASHIADVLAMAANKTAAGVGDMGYSFKYAAPISNALGISLEELAAASGLMVDKGLAGEQAGTALRMGLTRLADAPKEASKAMNALGFSAVDSAGKFKSIGQITDELRQSMKGMTDAQKVQALSTIFGTEAATGWLGLIDSAPGKLDKLTDSLKNSDGSATETANKMMNNAKGAIEQMMGAFESVQIAVMTPLLPLVKQIATEIGNFASNIKPEQIENFGNRMKSALESTYSVIKTTSSFIYNNWGMIKPVLEGIIGAVIGFKLAMISLSVISTVTQLFTALKTTITVVRGAMLVLNATMLANPMGLVVIGITALVAAGTYLYKNWDTVKAKTAALWNKLGGFPGVAKAVSGPLGGLIRAGKSLAGQWDSTKGVWTNVWQIMQRSAATAVNGIIKQINRMIGKINKLPGVNIAPVSGVNWGADNIGTQGRGGGDRIQGSAYFGEDYVPKNGMLYKLHKGERVLTAKQNKEYSGGGGGTNNNVYLTVNYNGSGPLDEQQMERFAMFLNNRLGQAMAGGA